MPRLFTALEVSRDAALSLSLLRGGLIGPKGSVRWIDPENYHITLRFIGDVEGHVADEIVHALDRIDRQSFTLQLAGVDVFGSKKPHSIYAGVAPSPIFWPYRLRWSVFANDCGCHLTRENSLRMSHWHGSKACRICNWLAIYPSGAISRQCPLT